MAGGKVGHVALWYVMVWLKQKKTKKKVLEGITAPKESPGGIEEVVSPSIEEHLDVHLSHSFSLSSISSLLFVVCLPLCLFFLIPSLSPTTPHPPFPPPKKRKERKKDGRFFLKEIMNKKTLT